MLKTGAQKTVTAGLFLALGVILPFATAHGFGMPGNIFLPMHLPVLICGYLCGPLHGGLLGLLLPFLNGVVTGMPALYPNALIMSLELLIYGVTCGLLYRFLKFNSRILNIYLSLIPGLFLGRLVYGIAVAILLFFDAGLGNISVVAATITGIPGIIAQLILVPTIVSALCRKLQDSTAAAKELIKSGKYSCVVIKGNRIVHTEKSRGISCIMKLLKEDKLHGAFVADAIVGKAAAMIFTAGGVKACYGETMSRSALEWFAKQGIIATYSTLTESISNRKGTGMCPMENTVKDINNPTSAIIALEEKLKNIKR